MYYKICFSTHHLLCVVYTKPTCGDQRQSVEIIWFSPFIVGPKTDLGTSGLLENNVTCGAIFSALVGDL